MNDERGLGAAGENDYWLGSLTDLLGQGGRGARFAGANVGPNIYPPHGMTLQELSEAQRRFTNYARIRLNSASEYDGGTEQSFEGMEPHRLLLELRQEIADAVNYLTFLDIQIERWGKRLEKIG